MIQVAVCPAGLLQANCYLAWNDETMRGFLVDPGDHPDRLLGFVKEFGVTPEAILLTHGHFDHIGAAEKLRDTLGIPVYAGALEQAVLNDPLLNLSGKYTRRPFTLRADRLLQEGEEFSLAGYTIRVLHTPGHSEGGVCYEVVGERILFSGDTLFAGSYGRTDGPDGDPEEMFRSLARLFKELPEEMNVLPGHGPETTIGEEKEQNPALWELRGRDLL